MDTPPARVLSSVASHQKLRLVWCPHLISARMIDPFKACHNARCSIAKSKMLSSGRLQHEQPTAFLTFCFRGGYQPSYHIDSAFYSGNNAHSNIKVCRTEALQQSRLRHQQSKGTTL
jgi:hypothetical protein